MQLFRAASRRVAECADVDADPHRDPPQQAGPLAAEHVAARLRSLHPGTEVRFRRWSPRVTVLDRSTAAIGGKGLFIRNLNRRCLPGGRPCRPFDEGRAGRTAGGIHDRRSTRARDPRDAFVSVRHARFAGLRWRTDRHLELRRQCQLLSHRPDLEDPTAARQCRDAPRQARIRGPDAIVLAVAGLERLGLGGRIRNTRAGIVLAGGRAGGDRHRVSDRRHATAGAAGAARARCYEQLPAGERAFAARLGGSCQSPVAAHATLIGTRLQLRGLVGSPDGACGLPCSSRGPWRSMASSSASRSPRNCSPPAGPLLELLRSAGAV